MAWRERSAHTLPPTGPPAALRFVEDSRDRVLGEMGRFRELGYIPLTERCAGEHISRGRGLAMAGIDGKTGTVRACEMGAWAGKKGVRGAVSAVQIVLILILALVLAAGVWWFLNQSGTPLAVSSGGGDSTAGGSADEAALPTTELSVDELYKAARGAMSANRMVAPPGNNALEFYLAIMAKRPDDTGAIEAVRELFPFATGSAEDQINQGNYDEAGRVIGLLAKADPSNYSLTILRSKLDAKRKQVEREQQLQAQQAAAQAARAQAGTAAAPAATTPAANGGTTPAESTAAAAPSGSTPTAPAPASAARPATEVAHASPPPSVAPATPAPEPAGESRDARMTAPPRPQYPAAAVRSRQSGWVEVEFTVGSDGSVQNARAVSSNPPRVFDREAVRAIEQAKFEPRLERGQPIATTLRRRIEFKLGE